MSSIVLYAVKGLPGDEDTSDSFTINLDKPIYLNPKFRYVVFFIGGSFWNTWNNISAANLNNLLRYKEPTDADGAPWRTLIIPDGAYSIDALNKEIFHQFELLGKLSTIDGEKVSPINFDPNLATLHIRIEVFAGWRVDFTGTQTFRRIVGFDSQIVTATKTGENEAEVENGLHSIIIHCSLVGANSVFNGRQSDIIYEFEITVPSGAQQILSPMNLTKLPLSTFNIQSYSIRITDQSGRPFKTDNPIMIRIGIEMVGLNESIIEDQADQIGKMKLIGKSDNYNRNDSYHRNAIEV